MKQQFARGLAVILVGGMLAAGCGGGGDDEPETAAVKEGEEAEANPTGTSEKPAPGVVATVKTPDPAEAKMASAVADAKTTAPIDLLYDLPAKPEVGQRFAVELAVKPRLPGDTLDVEIGDSPGIAIEGERMTRFMKVEAGQPYKFTFQARGDAEGLYYIAVITKLSTQVQSEGRAFSIPVVIGTPPAAAQKTAPQKDASGQPVQSMPARED
jgi:hypothetical protein